MRAAAKNDPQHLQALEDVKAWTRKRFDLPGESAILVAELTCAIPGCPPVETAVAFWTEDEKRHQFKLLKPVAEITSDDIAWLIGALDAPEGAGWDCC